MRRSQVTIFYLKKQKRFCSKLFLKKGRKHYDALDIRKVTNNKQFWKTIKLFLSEKVKNCGLVG